VASANTFKDAGELTGKSVEDEGGMPLQIQHLRGFSPMKRPRPVARQNLNRRIPGRYSMPKDLMAEERWAGTTVCVR
jgi:hypothetical protein